MIGHLLGVAGIVEADVAIKEGHLWCILGGSPWILKSSQTTIEIIEHLMDFSTVRERLSSGAYENLEKFEESHEATNIIGQSDTASVLHEALGYIRFLHDQVQVDLGLIYWH
ncbi:hypothetical protein J5N97_026132 [Dioscorea zingiberensis]|uniref:Uncharacterized protein n=1 Tax=Dioscorea zingiberensis TaxID=325984 RepID=A0A9D5C244_9LILI|nr:hypothetical protein J5N97_026132 [Dioscorea zingiberensis]